jgi:(1->4)-alpha-D-glucan 1-alpha-D-glucosylmutase
VDADGRRFGLLQTALKLTLPGVPDIYQGADLEDLSMVDPDNRRQVDFAMREALLAEVEAAPVRDLAVRPDGAGKLALVARLLGLRRRLPELFSAGTYEPIGDATSERLLAFMRRHGDTTLVVVGVRFKAPAIHGTFPLPVASGRWTDVLSREPLDAGDGIDLAALDGPLPVAVLLAEPTRREVWS